MKETANKSNQRASGCISADDPVLVGINKCLEIVFPDPEGRPSRRTFDSWRLAGYFPQISIGRRVFLDPLAVRKALKKRFTINSID